jgi:hypothetical protein
VKYTDPDGREIFWIAPERRESGWSHDAPQRIFGYNDSYDYYAQALFDIHGTKFDLNGITLRLWKGNYGYIFSEFGGAGGEIGFYNKFGRSMNRLELFLIGLVSTKLEVFRKETGDYVASREEKTSSYWTTSFSWDKQGKPEELYTVNTLTFKNEKTASGFADKLSAVKGEAESYRHNRNEKIRIVQEGKNVIITWGLD